MRKRSIFLKIYLWFWLTTALILAAQIGLDRLTDSGPPIPFHVQQTLKPVLSVYGRTAMQHYLSGDHEALRKWTEEVKASTALDAYLVDAKGRAATDGPLPQEVRTVAARARQSGKTELSLLRHRALLALPLKAEDGSLFYAVADMAGETFVPPPRRSPLLDAFRLLMILGVSGGVCYGLARYLTTPVIRLRDATRRLAAGELTVRVGKKVGNRNDEFSGLAEDFDRMAARIESLMTQQRQLLGDISHELRSPLTRLKLALELARRQTGTQAVTALNRIETEAELLKEMIAQVLTLTRLEGGIEAVPMTSVDVAKLVVDIADDADFEAHARNCSVRLVESTACTIPGNEELLRRAVENIVRNGVRYTRKNTTVDISVRLTTEHSVSCAEITVRDYGAGVPEEEIPHLFRPFYRISNARERQTGGAGLGLAIAERAVNLHRGSIRVSNAADGGLIAVIRLPLPSGLPASST
jgi:two-component system sensor histidine kinase CpxA